MRSVEEAIREAMECGALCGGSVCEPWPCGFRNRKAWDVDSGAYRAEHNNHHLVLAVRRLLREVATEAWTAGYMHDSDDEHQPCHEFKSKCRDVLIDHLCGPAPGEGGKP